MKLKAKFVKWSAGIPVVMLHKETAAKLGVHAQGRVSLRTFSKPYRELSTIVDTVEELVKKDEIAVSLEIKKRLNLKKENYLDVNLAEFPDSLSFIKKKLDKKRLSQKEIFEIISEIVNNELSESEITLFIAAMYGQGMNIKETTYLIKAILKCGSTFKLQSKFIADKHCVGGIPGNRTTPIVVSICAAAGLTMPKSSSRAITSAAGTADVMEIVSPVEFSVRELKKIIKKTKAFLVWGGALEMAPADSKIISIEKELKIDPEAQLLASIMAKKLAVGSMYILIDIPYGKTAKFTKTKALNLKRKFEKLGQKFHKKLKVVLTKGDEPIGNGVGPALELIDVLKVLRNEKEKPKDLEKKSIFLAGKLIEMAGKEKKGKGIKKAEEILESGKAFNKFKEIIKAQGGAIKKIKPGKFKHDILADSSGKISEINNKLVNLLARVAGCPADKLSGIYFYVHKGDKIKKHEKLFTIYSESKSRLNSAIKFYRENKIVKIK